VACVGGRGGTRRNEAGSFDEVACVHVGSVGGGGLGVFTGQELLSCIAGGEEVGTEHEGRDKDVAWVGGGDG